VRRQSGLSVAAGLPSATPSGKGAQELSVIIPIGPGDQAWQGLLDAFAAAGLPHACERLLVFADGDPQRAQAPPEAITITAPAGRARQINAGIDAASGEWLWLLHADSRPCGDTLPALLGWLRKRPRALGWFELAFAQDGPWLARLNACGANLRSRWLGLPFGDQGFLLHREDAARIGAFDPALPYGEDHDWVWRARRGGVPLRAVGGTLATSARRYAEQGWLRTTARHLVRTWRQARREWRR
jgi:hypothetical protein